MKSIIAYIVLLLVATGILYAVVQTKQSISMEVTDRAEQTRPNGEKVMYFSVRVSDYDSLLCKQFANATFHREVSDSLSVNMPIQMTFFFYKESNLRELNTDELLGMSHGDASALTNLRKLAADTSGYGVIRFSDVYSLFGRDSLYGMQGKVAIPYYGIQLNDFVRTPTSKK